MKLISIIVCTYNQENTIRRCLDAILSQESPWPFEVIIGEDGGTDGTRDICEDYERRYPDIVRMMPQAPNKGILQNYFDCVRDAKGKYIMECGGDDEWMPGRIKLCLDIMESHPDVGMVMTPYITKDEQTGKVHPLNPTPWHEGVYSGEELTYRFACMTTCSPGDSAMTRTSMLRDVMGRWPRFFNGREFLMEDLQIAVTMGMVGKLYYHEKPTYYYYVGLDNISLGNNQRKRLRFETNGLKLLVDLTKQIPLDRTKVVVAMEYRLFVCLMHCFRIHDRNQRDAVLLLAKKWGIPVKGRARVVKAVTSFTISWWLMLKLRNLYVAVKRFRV